MLITKAPFLDDLVADYMEADAFCFDVETRPGMGVEWTTNDERKAASLNPLTNEVFWISMATTGRCDVIPLGHPQGEQIGWQPKPLKPGQKATKVKVPKWAPAPEQLTPGDFFSATEPLWKSSIRKVNHNIPFDLLTIAKYLGFVPGAPYTDTLVQAQLIDENRPLDLGSLVRQVFKFKYEKIGKNLETQPYSKAGSYSYYDAKYTWLLWNEQCRVLEEIGKADYAAFQNDVTEVLVHMRWKGQPVRGDEVSALEAVLSQEMLQKEHDLFSRAGRPFKLTAPAEKGWFVYEVLGHKPTVFTPKQNNPSTAEIALKKYDFDPWVQEMMAWDDLHKLHSTYVLNYGRLAHKGRLHPNFKQTGAVTGRLSAADPNVQNVPRPDTPVGKQIRGMFWGGDDEHCLVVADYSQIELRILAHFSGDPTMLRAFADGLDIHQATANTLGTTRVVGKSINFAIPYGAGYRRVAVQAGVPPEVAKQFYEAHQDQFPAVWTWIDMVKRKARKIRPHEGLTLLGRSRRVPGIAMAGNSEYARETRSRQERQVVNARIQGSAADIIGTAMVRLHDALPDDMYLTMQVHDELVIVTPRDRAEECAEIVREAMIGEEMQMLRGVRIFADIKIVDRWSEAKSD